MKRIQFHDFELAEIVDDDYACITPIASHINVEAMKILIDRQDQLFKRVTELEDKLNENNRV